MSTASNKTPVQKPVLDGVVWTTEEILVLIQCGYTADELAALNRRRLERRLVEKYLNTKNWQMFGCTCC